MLARVAIDGAAARYDKLYDYYLPAWLDSVIQPGCRVMVPFGRANRPRLALVMEISELKNTDGLKPIISAEDTVPIVGSEGIELIHYLKKQTYCRYFEALSALIPPGIGLHLHKVVEVCAPLPDPLPPLGEGELCILKYLKRRRGTAPLADILSKSGARDAKRALALLEELGLCRASDRARQKRAGKTEVWVAPKEGRADICPTPKQQAVLDLLCSAGEMLLGEATQLAGVGSSVIKRLEQAGLIEVFSRPAMPNASTVGTEKLGLPQLSDRQRQAADELGNIYSEGGVRTALLHGVTGSGKTAVYLHLISDVVASGKQVIVLVPEISLTPQAIEIFCGHFGSQAAVVHSSLSATERSAAYERIRSGLVNIVIGTRSAVFSPLDNLGLIIIDEEQEHTYHSESAPRYHASQVAAFRCRLHGAMLLLASATPAVETYEAALSGRIRLIKLTERYAGAKLPEVHTIDLREAVLAGSSTSITEELSGELLYNLKNGEQSILLLNRRGYHTLVKCSACGEAVVCPHCDVSMTYHAVGNKLLCHYCGYQRSVGERCSLCGSELTRYTGVGTQRVTDELACLFPEAKILRMDADTTSSRYAHEKAFADFASGKYDIMVGTQMVAKGLNFPRVTLVGVLLADQSFYTDDFRSYERSFSLITQVIGRCGRGELPGRAYIQTYTPHNRVIPLAVAQDYPGFFRDEIVFRKVGLYPPFCDLMLIGFTGQEQREVDAAAKRFADDMCIIAAQRYPELPLRLLGPAPFSVPKVAGRWRSRIVLKCRRSAKLHELISTLQGEFCKDSKNNGVSCYIDPYCDNL